MNPNYRILLIATNRSIYRLLVPCDINKRTAIAEFKKTIPQGDSLTLPVIWEDEAPMYPVE